MLRFRYLIVAFTTASLGFWANAQDLKIEDIDKSQFKNLIGDFSANSLHTSVQGAAPLGDIWGFEVGLVGGLTQTPELDKIVKQAEAGASADQIYHAELLGVLSVPFALTGEIGLIPKLGGDDFKFSAMSLALKFTPTELFFELPVDIAVKAALTKVEAEFHQEVNGNPVDYDFTNDVTHIGVFVSKNFVVLEPYAGVGLVNAKGDLSFSGTALVFDPTYTVGTSASEKTSSTAFILGTEAKLLLLKLGLEYTHVFDTSRFTGKISFYF